MTKILYTLLMLLLCTVSFAQETDPVDSIQKYEPIYGTLPADSVNYVFEKLDQLPEFPGGSEGMLHYLAGNVRYPSKARKKNIQGKVVITFVVDKNGSVVAPNVTRSVNKEIDEEAMRVITDMPRWKPGLMNGKPVKVLYHLPITFKLSE
jgi:TonB family protein